MSRRNRSLVTALTAFALLACVACAPAGSGPQSPSGPSGNRILLGRLVVDGSPASDWVNGGPYSGAELVIDDHVTIHDDRADLQATSADAPGPPFTSVGGNGGPIRFGERNGPVFILGLRVSRALVILGTSSVFPILVRIPPRVGPCDYFGTIHLRHAGEGSVATVVDDFDADAPTLARSVGRCTPTRNLAEPLNLGKPTP